MKKNYKKVLLIIAVVVCLVILVVVIPPLVKKIKLQMYVRKELKNQVVIKLCNKIYTSEYLRDILKEPDRLLINQSLSKCEDQEKNIIYKITTMRVDPLYAYFDTSGNEIGAYIFSSIATDGRFGECFYKGKKCLEFNKCGPVICCKGDNCR